MTERVKTVTVKLDVTRLDTRIAKHQIKEIHIVYYNIAEDAEWEETVPYEIIDKKWNKKPPNPLLFLFGV